MERGGCGAEYFSDGARSMSSGAATPTGDEESQYYNLDTGPGYLGLGDQGYALYGGQDSGGCPSYDLHDAPIIRVVKRRNTANKKERR